MQLDPCMTPPDSTLPGSSGSTDYCGVGQSGYTAGRRAPDPSLARQLQSRNANYPGKADDEVLRDELETDERFIGRGGSMPRH
jgi:hypothetical protein